MADTRHCWRCRTNYPPETVVCVRCGVNLVTGEEIAQPEAEAPPLTGMEKVHALIADLMPGLLRPRVWVPVILLCVVALGVLGLGWLMFTWGAALTAIAIMAAGFIIYAQAMVWLMTGQFWFMTSALAEFQSQHWPIFFLLTFGPGALLLTLLKLFVNVTVD